MAHRRFEFDMPAADAVVFDAFHYTCWRHRWDSLVSDTKISGGTECPYVGAQTENAGASWMRPLSMRTEFVSYQRPQVAAARSMGRSFPFSRWAASMQHRNTGADRSVLIYTYTFDVWPRPLRWFMEPVVRWVFDWQTRRRFARLQQFLQASSAEIQAWQRQREG